MKWGENWREQDLGIEKAEEGRLRGAECLNEIESSNPSKNILIVSHGAILKHTLKGLIPDFEAEDLLGNTSVTEIIRTEGVWKCLTYNCIKHLVKEVDKSKK
ncbi:histidine phosphatase family protein [Paenibacillus sp. GCM10028914]|uniref:histidine phosphatase family protein n=1 Tax=Paenibacillus sp. GCM10028914 TaxID=3273416 RepID=UPI00361A788E